MVIVAFSLFTSAGQERAFAKMSPSGRWGVLKSIEKCDIMILQDKERILERREKYEKR